MVRVSAHPEFPFNYLHESRLPADAKRVFSLSDSHGSTAGLNHRSKTDVTGSTTCLPSTIDITMDLPTSFSLNNGTQVPVVGLGTFQGESGESPKQAVLAALKLGYRHIDCANAYGNEKEVGEAIRESGIPREGLYITSKLAQTWHKPADVEKALDQSLQDLGLEYGTMIAQSSRSNRSSQESN